MTATRINGRLCKLERRYGRDGDGPCPHAAILLQPGQPVPEGLMCRRCGRPARVVVIEEVVVVPADQLEAARLEFPDMIVEVA